MKMIASTKLAKAQRAMQAGKQYGGANAGSYSFRRTSSSQTYLPLLTFYLELFANASPEEKPKKIVYLAISSDKGLCGGVHSSVSKHTRRAIAESESHDQPVMVIGDKSKAQLSRMLGNNLVLTFNQIGRDIPTFADATGVADLIVKSGVEYDAIRIVYNKFVSAISYEATEMEVLNENGLKEAREWLCIP